MPYIRYLKSYSIAEAGSIRKVSSASARALIAIKAAVLVGDYSEEEQKLFSDLEKFAKQFPKTEEQAIADPVVIEEEKPKRGRPTKK